MKTTILIILILTIVFFLSALATAQPGFPGDPVEAPIDGGLALLAAAGGAYGIKKLRDKKKREEQSDI